MKPDERSSAGPRTTPRGGWGNAEPPTHLTRRAPYDIAAFARYNAGIKAARTAYAEHRAATDRDYHCRAWCGTKTRRTSGLCKRCEEGDE